MTHPMNDDTANFELSLDQLDDVAGGNWFGSALNWVGNEVSDAGHAIGKFFTNPVVASIAAGIVAIGAVVVGGGGATNLKLK